ncbi:copper chaperone PCu(A)C [uncultured Jatrophihabitans sp.]|uniref:copper chaperone PCu(A)C n=1 Tax=uncultured Jatrophihabitans sp. TaxID=1610747 RepID=UPI0035C9C3A7
MKLPLPALAAGAIAIALGAAGLARAAAPESSGTAAGTASGAPIVVSGAYVYAPVPPADTAAAYFTVTNTTGEPDRLDGVLSGAGAKAVVHAVGANGAMSAMSPTGVTVPAHGSLVLSPGKGHVMIEHLYGAVKAGQYVNLELDFADAGSIEVSAPVIAYGSTPPGGASSGAPS